MIIDVHTHIGLIGDFEKLSFEDTLRAMLKEMKANKVGMAFVLPYFTPRESSQMLDETLKLVKDVKEIRVLGTVDLVKYAQSDLEHLEDLLSKKLIIGIKLYLGYQPVYPTDERCLSIYKMCSKYGVPVMFHTGDTLSSDAHVKYSHPLHIDDVAVDFPDLKIVIAHVGNPWTIDCAEVLYKNKNVYADISGLGKFVTLETPDGELAKKRIKELIVYAEGPRKLLYGTDWSLVPMKTYLKFVRSLGIGKKDMEYVMWKNAQQLFNLKLNNL